MATVRGQRGRASYLELFRTKGYAATKVDDIATAAGATRVTFYASFHFPSRADLMKALIDELGASWAQLLT
ncbi:TetR/AcrR family transcriptional regulator [Streptomyces sp. NPDC050534]|uniref:TetR/AcrR family transcriptional regulator n=1 Tax=Streptomyces sp. NPDC050534 TaxID=3365625 RepID=UPI003797EC61